MQRRRMDRLGRVALQAAYWGLADAPVSHLVFASRYGDMQRSVELLEQLASGDGLSPTAFSLSVHNAIAALFSITRNDPSVYTAVSAGRETAAAGLTEALTLLEDAAAAVLLVVYDEPLPEAYASFHDDIAFPRAWACRLTADASGARIALTAAPATPQPPAALPPDLALLAFLSGTCDHWQQQEPLRTWVGRRD